MIRSVVAGALGEDQHGPSDISDALTTSRQIAVMAVTAAARLIVECTPVMDTTASIPVVRAILLTALNCPFQTIYIAERPYPRDLLPPIASALAFCPWACPTMTPTVQVMASMMVRDMLDGKPGALATLNRGRSEAEMYLALGMVLRMNYVLMPYGIAMLNAMPFVLARQTSSAEIFVRSRVSEFVATIVHIHARLDVKPKIVTMGASASAMISDAFAAFPATRRMCTTVRTGNPAAVARRSEGSHLDIDGGDHVCLLDHTPCELHLMTATGTPSDRLMVTAPELMTYSSADMGDMADPSTCHSLLGTIAVTSVDDAVDILSEQLITVAAIMEALPAAAPFAKLLPISSGEAVGSGQTTGIHVDGPDGSSGKMSMQHMMATRGISSLRAAGNSTFMRLRNKDGTANVTQESIVVDSINAIIRDVSKQVTMASKDVAGVASRLDQGAVKDVEQAFNESVVGFIKALDEGTKLLEGFGAIFEGGMGVVEQEWGSSAPLMRHPDGSARESLIFAESRGQVPGHAPGAASGSQRGGHQADPHAQAADGEAPADPDQAEISFGDIDTIMGTSSVPQPFPAGPPADDGQGQAQPSSASAQQPNETVSGAELCTPGKRRLADIAADEAGADQKVPDLDLSPGIKLGQVLDIFATDGTIDADQVNALVATARQSENVIDDVVEQLAQMAASST